MIINRTICFLATIGMLSFSACEIDQLEKIEDATTPLIYLSQLEEGGVVNLKTENVIVDKTNQTMLLILGVHRSGVQSREAFTVDFAIDNSKIPSGTVAFKTTDYMLSSSRTSNVPVTKVTVPAGVSSVPIYMTIPKATFDANVGKKLALHIGISNPTNYKLNDKLSQADILFEPGSFPYVVVDLTGQYIKNAGNPFLRSDNDGTRFGNLKDWTVNSVVLNQDANKHGGFDSYQSGGYMSMERFTATTPFIPNGKIFQTFTLPAGKYEFQIDFSTATIVDGAFVTVAAGKTLPDLANVSTAISSARVLSSTALQTIKTTFDLPVATEVSMGVLASFTTANQAFRANSVKLTQLKNPFE